MSGELIYVRFLQFSVLALTVVFAVGIKFAKDGRIELHKKVNLAVITITALAVVGLLVTLAMGFKYEELKTSEALLNIGPESMKTRLNIHRIFSMPLFFSLIYTTWTGVKNMAKQHKKSIAVTALFWLGTLITALLFF